MTVTLRQLEVLVAVLDSGGFGAAATQLRMSQSAVSHTLATLERSVAAPLVVRTTPVIGTLLGEAVLSHARSMLATARALDCVVDLHRGGVGTGTIRLAAAPTASHRLVPDLMRRWRAELPGLDVRLFEGADDELSAWLECGTVDAAVLIDADPLEDGAVVLARDDFRVVLPCDHPLAREDSVDLSDLEDDPLLVSSSGCERQVTELHDRAGIPYVPSQRVHGISTLFGMIGAGLGVAIMPSLASTMISSDLVMVRLRPYLERTLALTGPDNRPWHPAVTRMQDIAVSAATV